MADLYHNFGGDLVLGATGDLLATQDQTTETTQRLLRRLLTPQGDYIWELPFGAGLPQQVGLPTAETAIRNAIRAQIFQDSGVAKIPEPVITFTRDTTGLAVANISYTDAVTGQTQQILLPLG